MHFVCVVFNVIMAAKYEFFGLFAVWLPMPSSTSVEGCFTVASSCTMVYTLLGFVNYGGWFIVCLS